MIFGFYVDNITTFYVREKQICAKIQERQFLEKILIYGKKIDSSTARKIKGNITRSRYFVRVQTQSDKKIGTESSSKMKLFFQKPLNRVEENVLDQRSF